MRKKISFFLFAAATTFAFSSCVDDSYLNQATPVADQSFTEEFDTVRAALSRGWVLKNTSDPLVSSQWQQGGDVIPWFYPYSSNGSNAGFIGVNGIVSNTNVSVISNWLISPVITFQNGDTVSFYTRAFVTDLFTPGDSSDYGNRMLVRLNTSNEGTAVGTAGENGDFTMPLIDVNPTYHVWSQTAPDPLSYPVEWTKMSAIIGGLNKPVRGRIGFKFYIEDATNYGSGVAVDKFEYKSLHHK
jgi:hypothetical protein